MTAHVHFFNAQSGYATARHVLSVGSFDAESQAAAAELLKHSEDARDRDLAQLYERRMAELRLAASKPRQRGFDWPLVLEEARDLMIFAVVAGGVVYACLSL